MELLYVELITTNKQSRSEYYYFLVNYIIGERIYIHSNTGFNIFINKNYTKISLSDFIKYYESYCIYYFNNNKEELDKVFKYRDDFIKINKEYKAHLNKYKITKEHIVLKNSVNNNFNIFKDKIIDVCKNNVTLLNLSTYSEIINSEVIQASFSLFKRNGLVDDTELGEIIFNNFSSKEKLIIAGSLYEEIIDSLNESEDEKPNDEKNNIVYLPDLELFRFPISMEISKDHLQLIRLQFNSNISSLFNKIQNYRNNDLQHKINDTLAEKLSAFYETINDDIEDIQNKIDNNIYFQKIKNSDSNYKTVKVNLGIIPYITLLIVYFSVKAITREKFIELKNRCIKEFGTFTGDFFLYYEIEPKIKEKENTDV